MVASPDIPRERVVSLIQKLDDDAARLRLETQMLQEARGQWTPALVGGRTTLIPGERPLPSRCSNKLEQAAAYERQIKSHERRASTGDREAQRANQERQQIEAASTNSVQEAHRRRMEADYQLEELLKSRRQHEADHRRKMLEEDFQIEAELKSVENEIEEVWKAAAARSAEARRSIAAHRQREKDEVAAAHAEFEAWSSAFERSMEEYDSKCGLLVQDAMSKVKEADAASKKVSEECDKEIQSSRDDADGAAEENLRIQDGAVDEANKQLVIVEKELAEELTAIAMREKMVHDDWSAEDKVDQMRARVAEDIKKRRDECERRVQDCLATMKRLTREASEGAASAAKCAQDCQVRSDEQISKTLADVEEFASSFHKDRIIQLQAGLNKAVDNARSEMHQRVAAFQNQTDEQTREANMSLVAADKKVEELRSWASSLIDQNSQSAEKDIDNLRTERQRIVAQSTAKVLETQEQLMKYVGSQFEDMKEKLSKTDPSEMSLRLDYSKAVD